MDFYSLYFCFGERLNGVEKKPIKHIRIFERGNEIDNLLQPIGGVKEVIMNSDNKTIKDFVNSNPYLITKELFTYTIGIIGILQKKSDEEIRLLGTGTLIKANGFYGILTAEHVSREVKKLDEIGILIGAVNEIIPQPPRYERFTIKKMCLEVIDVFKSSDTAEGPDLGLIRILSCEELSTLKAIKSFFNISVNRKKFLENHKDLDSDIWVLCGIPDELTIKERSERKGYDYFIRFCPQCYFTDEPIEGKDRGTYDLLKINFDYIKTEGRVKNFGGFSGGGLWKLNLIESNEKKPGTIKPFLVGVIFFQENINDQVSKIICHGPRSIYLNVIETLEKIFLKFSKKGGKKPMADDAKEKLEKLVNSSGFPLQIALQHLIESKKSDHGWDVLSHEHPWANKEAGSEGFIDLILVNNSDRHIMVVECKRVRDTYWIFLVPSEKTDDKETCHLLDNR